MQFTNTLLVASVALSGFAVAAPVDATTNDAATFPLLAGWKLNGTAMAGRPRLGRLGRPRGPVDLSAARESLAAGLASGSLPAPALLQAWIDAGIPVPEFLAPYVNVESKTINITAIESAISSGAIQLPAPLALALGTPLGRPRLPGLYNNVLEAWGIDTDGDDDDNEESALPGLMPLRPFGGLRGYRGSRGLRRGGLRGLPGSPLAKLWQWRKQQAAAMMAATPAAAAAAGTAADAAVAAAPAAPAVAPVAAPAPVVAAA